MDKKTLVLGSNGFLGKGLCIQFDKMLLPWKGVDIECADVQLDLTKTASVRKIVDELEVFNEVVLLAAKVGSKLFESDKAEAAAIYNQTIFDNVIKAIKKAAKKHKHPYSMTFYSTSEVFGSQVHVDDVISESTQAKFDISNPRHLYSFQKWNAEKTLFDLKHEHPEILKNVKIIRPFNIYGARQKRGVLYDMVKSALCNGTISYSADTTRTMTSIDIASKAALDVVLSDKDVVLNVADKTCSMTMKQLAQIVAEVLEKYKHKKCRLVELPYDASIQYRTVSKIVKNIDAAKKKMEKHIIALYDCMTTDLF